MRNLKLLFFNLIFGCIIEDSRQDPEGYVYLSIDRRALKLIICIALLLYAVQVCIQEEMTAHVGLALGTGPQK